MTGTTIRNTLTYLIRGDFSAQAPKDTVPSDDALWEVALEDTPPRLELGDQEVLSVDALLQMLVLGRVRLINGCSDYSNDTSPRLDCCGESLGIHTFREARDDDNPGLGELPG